MLRPSVSRRVVGLTLAVTAGTGIGLGAASAWSAWGASPAPISRAWVPPGTAAAPSTTAPGGTAAPASGLTLDQAESVATGASAGQVVKAKQDVGATGLVYDITVLHQDGTTTDVEVDAATGQVVGMKNDPDQWNGS